jgi:hypothetical protein
MAKDTYKKRAKGSWHQGKGCKGDAEERQYAKKEVEESIQHDVLERPMRHKGKRKRNKKASLEYTIEWYTQKIAEHEQMGRGIEYTGYLRDGLRRAKREWEEKYGEKK